MTDERRTIRVASAVTPSERAALEGVCRIRGNTVSELLREMSVADVVKEWDRILSVTAPGDE